MYAKLFSRITESSIIEESVTTRWVFVALLAIADQDGTVIGTDVAIARRINVELEDFQSSMKVLMSEDKDSNNPEYQGRRVLPSEGERGYFLTGYGKYKSIKTEEERRSYMRQYMHEYRSKNHVDVNNVKSVNNLLAPLTHTDTSTNKDLYTNDFLEFWKSYPRKVGKGGAWKVWKRIKPDVELVKKMIEAVSFQKNTSQWSDEKFIPHPETWLNKRKWEDEVESKPVKIQRDF